MRIASPGEPLPWLSLRPAATPEIACLYSKQTDRAIARGAFGMPFYIFADEPFWGQDRLDLLDRALAHARD